MIMASPVAGADYEELLERETRVDFVVHVVQADGPPVYSQF